MAPKLAEDGPERALAGLGGPKVANLAPGFPLSLHGGEPPLPYPRRDP